MKKKLGTYLSSIKKKLPFNDTSNDAALSNYDVASLTNSASSSITDSNSDSISETLYIPKSKNGGFIYANEKDKDYFDLALEQNKLELAYLVKDKFSNNLTVQMFVDRGIENEFLYSAIKNGNIPFANYLIAHRHADLASVSNKYLNNFKIVKENFDLALENNNLELAYLLKDEFQDNYTIQMFNDRGIENVFLYAAIKNGNIPFMDYLIYRGADIYSVFDKNLNAYKIACENEDLEMMGYIMENFPDYPWN